MRRRLTGVGVVANLVDAIHALASGRTYFPAAEPAPRADTADVRDALTARELEVLRLVEEGLKNRAIAERLKTRPRTVQFHISNLFAKLGAASRTEMLHIARRRGWLG